MNRLSNYVQITNIQNWSTQDICSRLENIGGRSHLPNQVVQHSLAASHASTSGPPYKTIVSLTSTSFPLRCRGVDSRTILKPPTCISNNPAAIIASVPTPNGGL